MNAIARIRGGRILVGYRYFWVKAVDGFDQTEHCAKCLTGNWLHRTSWPWPMNRPTTLDLMGAPFGYICGVSLAGYRDNLHAPFVLSRGDEFTVTLVEGQSLTVSNARLLAINPLPNGWRGLGRPFTTCRNYQFGVERFGFAEAAPLPTPLGL